MAGAVIGAGIGGLTTAVALKQRGIDVDIFEAASQFSPVGAGILVPPNAMVVLKKLGLAKAVTAAGVELDWLTILDDKGQVLSKSKASYSYKKGNAPTIAIKRAKLHKLLLEQLAPQHIHLNHRCLELVEYETGIAATFDSGSESQFDFIVGADGLHSHVRQHLFPDQHPQYVGQLCWRGMIETKLARPWRNQLTEIWGAGLRFGFVQVSKKYVYWYATKVQKHHPEKYAYLSQNALCHEFQNFPAIVWELIYQTPADAIVYGPIEQLPPLACWHSQKAVLLGDAAHAATPNLGQGGALAMEDAWILAKKLARHNDPAMAFGEYQKMRLERVERIVKMSHQVGNVASFESPLACVLRNVFMSHVPSFVTRQQQKLLYDCASIEESE